VSGPAIRKKQNRSCASLPFSPCGVLCLKRAHRRGYAQQRVLAPDDYLKFLDVTAPQISPDGTAVAYLVARSDREADEAKGAVWLTNWEGIDTRGGEARQIAPVTGEITGYAWSPDGKRLVLAMRQEEGEAGGRSLGLQSTCRFLPDQAWADRRCVIVLEGSRTRS
jgi:dipeptidyl aminopeptidase/acylaminoacyl peptidase